MKLSVARWSMVWRLCVILVLLAPFGFASRGSAASPNPFMTVSVYELPTTLNPSRMPDLDEAYDSCQGAWTQTLSLYHDFQDKEVAGCRADYVLVNIKGAFEFSQPTTEDLNVSFDFAVDDGAWVTLNGKQIFVYDMAINSAGNPNPSFGLLSNRKHTISVWYYERSGNAHFRTIFSVNGGTNEYLKDGASCGTGCTVKFYDGVGSTATTTTSTTSTIDPTSTSSSSSTTTTSSVAPPRATTTTLARKPGEPTVVPTTMAPVPSATTTTAVTTTTTTSPETSGTTTTIGTPGPSPQAQGTAGGSGVFDRVDGTPNHLDMVLALNAGQPASGKGVTSTARGLRPGSTVTLELHSTPVVLATVVADARGDAVFDAAMPASVDPGVHMVVLKGTTPDGRPVTSVAAFTVRDDGIVGAVVPPAERMTSSLPSESALARAVSAGRPLYDVDANTGTVAALGVAASILVAAAGSGAVGARRSARAGGRGSLEGERFDRTRIAQESSPTGPENTTADLAGLAADPLLGVVDEKEGWGDRHGLWSLPGGRAWHDVLRRVLAATERRSTVLTRVVCDGQWVRAAFGSLDVPLCLMGAAFGLAGAMQVHFAALAPSWSLVVAMVLLAMANALAGLAASVVYVASVALSGNATTAFDVRTLLGLSVLVIGLPLLSNSIRPLRRTIEGRADVAERIADYLITPLFVAYAASSMYQALNGLSGLQLVTSSDATGLRNVVFVAAVVRLAAEDLVSRHFPVRSREVLLEPGAEPGTAVQLGTQVGRVAILVLVMVPFFGVGWRTWLMIGLAVALPIAGMFADRFPDFSGARKWIPRGILRSVVMMYIGTWFATWVLGSSDDPSHVRAVAVLLMLPGLAVGCIDLVTRSGGEWPETWWKRAGGAALWAFSAAVLTGLVVI